MAKILVVDDELGLREALYHAFTQRGHEVSTAINNDHAANLMGTQVFDLIILDIVMPDEYGTELLKKLRATGNPVPVVIYSVRVDAALEKEMRQAGANEVLHKSVSLQVLMDRTEKVLRSIGNLPGPPTGSKKRLLVIDDDKSVRQFLILFFEKKGYEVIDASSGEEGLEMIPRVKPDIVLLDMHMGGINGLQTLKKIRELDPKLGVVMATGDEDDRDVHAAMEMGAYGYVLKPFDFLYLELVVASRLSIAQTPDSM